MHRPSSGHCVICITMASNVNDLWKELQAAAAPAKGRLKGLSYTHQRVETPGGGTKKKKGPGFIEQLQPKATATPPADSDIMATLQRDINCLSDGNRRLRIKALENISAKLLGAPGAPGASTQALQAALCGLLLVPTVRLLADPAERCRELAASFLGAAAGRLEDASGLLPTLVPALEERMGSAPVEEGAEEVRLLLVQLAGRLVQRHAAEQAGSGGGLLGAVVQVLCRGLEDSCPDVKKAACGAVASLADGSCPAQALEPHLDALLSSLLPDLQHQHSRVRLEALGALNSLVLKGLRCQALQERVAPAVQPLVHDHAVSVRAALFTSVAAWMGCRLQQPGAPLPSLDSPLAGQFRSSVPIFLPVLLLALTEESADIRSSGMQQVEGVAAAYSTLQGEAGEVFMEADEEEWGGRGRSISELPGYSHPFQARPSPAARHMVRQQLPRLVELAAKGSREWTAALRAEAARLLHATLVFAEGGVLEFLPAVLHSLRAGVADEDPAIASQALAAAGVLSVNVPARHWAAFMVEAVTAEQPSMAQRVADLRLLCALLGAAAAVGQQAQQDTVQLLAAALGHEELLGVDHAPLHAQLLAAVSCLVRWAHQQCASVAPELLCLLLRVAAAERGRAAVSKPAGGVARSPAPAPQLTAGSVMTELAAACGVGSAQELCDQLAPRLLPVICQEQQAWDSLSPSWREFSSLLRCCGSGALQTCGSTILGVLQPLCTSHDAGRDPELQLAALALVSELLQDDSKAAAWRGGLGVALAQQVLLPVLVWRAGKHPAAARHAALTALVTMLGTRRLGEGGVLELVEHARLLPLLHQCLDEDYMPETRAAACTALTLLLQTVGHSLSAEQLHSMRQELLRRLDDSSDPIRIAACQALLVSLSCPDPVSALEPSVAEQLASTLLVHMDDANPAVCEAACAVLERLAKHCPGAVRECAAAAVGVHRRREYLDRVLAACGSVTMQEA